MPNRPAVNWCPACLCAVDVRSVSSVEVYEFWGERVTNYGLKFSCAQCDGPVSQEIACVICRIALPEEGYDECSQCLAKIITDEQYRPAARNQLVMSPLDKIERLTHWCGVLSTPGYEVVSEVRNLHGKTVIAFCRQPRVAHG